MGESKKETVFQGIPASPGIAMGFAFVFAGQGEKLDVDSRSIKPEEVDSEILLFNEALDKTRKQIKDFQRRVQATLEEKEARIFDAHLLIVDDKMVQNGVIDSIRNQLKAADCSFTKTINKYISAISMMEDECIRERAIDIKDVAEKILSNIRSEGVTGLDQLPGPRIIITKELAPSSTALLDRVNVKAFGIETGSQTSHTAILARSMKIPSVVGIQDISSKVVNGDYLIIDGFIGTVILNPSENTKSLYVIKESRKEKYYSDLLKESRLRPETIDGFCIQLAANIELPEDVEDARRYGAAGIGLFRTEYIYMNEPVLPSEEKQFNVYRKITTDMDNQPVMIRTLDIGGDKLSSIITPHHEVNPFLGLRAVRLCLEHEHIIRTQLRAILRASAYGNIRLLFPMITCVEELDKLYEILNEIKAELKKSKIAFNENIEVGIMIETPAAAIISPTLAKKVDFFSIGTNDLIQYTLAVDRGNEKVAYLYQPTHPAILQLIDNVVRAAKTNNVWVSVCGEMAGAPQFTALLIGLGVHELSMSSVSMGAIRRIIRRMRMHEAVAVAKSALRCTTAEEALALSEDLLYRIAPDIVSVTLAGKR